MYAQQKDSKSVQAKAAKARQQKIKGQKAQDSSKARRALQKDEQRTNQQIGDRGRGEMPAMPAFLLRSIYKKKRSCIEGDAKEIEKRRREKKIYIKELHKKVSL